jgi:hypothetical protein
MTVLTLSPRYVTPFAQAQTSATGDAARLVAKLLRDVLHDEWRRASDWRPVVQAKLEQLALECSASNWDGYGATGISAGTKQAIQRFVGLLPPDLPEPEVVPDPEGEIWLCWDLGKDRVFTVSIGDSGILNYAGLLGTGVKRHGQEPFRGEVPKIIIESIRAISSSL